MQNIFLLILIRGREPMLVLVLLDELFKFQLDIPALLSLTQEPPKRAKNKGKTTRTHFITLILLIFFPRFYISLFKTVGEYSPITPYKGVLRRREPRMTRVVLDEWDKFQPDIPATLPSVQAPPKRAILLPVFW